MGVIAFTYFYPQIRMQMKKVLNMNEFNVSNEEPEFYYFGKLKDTAFNEPLFGYQHEKGSLVLLGEGVITLIGTRYHIKQTKRTIETKLNIKLK
jgi:hypothetical protein